MGKTAAQCFPWTDEMIAQAAELKAGGASHETIVKILNAVRPAGTGMATENSVRAMLSRDNQRRQAGAPRREPTKRGLVAKIEALARRGLAKDAIAKQLSCTPDYVEMRLNLMNAEARLLPLPSGDDTRYVAAVMAEGGFPRAMTAKGYTYHVGPDGKPWTYRRIAA